MCLLTGIIFWMITWFHTNDSFIINFSDKKWRTAFWNRDDFEQDSHCISRFYERSKGTVLIRMKTATNTTIEFQAPDFGQALTYLGWVEHVSRALEKQHNIFIIKCWMFLLNNGFLWSPVHWTWKYDSDGGIWCPMDTFWWKKYLLSWNIRIS